MSTTFKNQTKLRIRLTTDANISGATCLIKYIKPSGITGSWSATIENATTGIIYYDIVKQTTPSPVVQQINEDGWWRLWAHITWADGTSAPGEIVRHYFKVEGE